MDCRPRSGRGQASLRPRSDNVEGTALFPYRYLSLSTILRISSTTSANVKSEA